jgi:hypothetical protein
MPIYFGDLESSLKATMVFPCELQKAEAFAGWLILRAIRNAQDKGLHGWSKALQQQDDFGDQLLKISLAAADFAYVKDEADRNAADGVRAGVITATLHGMICDDILGASWSKAIEITEKMVTAFNRSRRVSLPANRSQFADCLKKFAPVLHLLGARTIRRQDTVPAGVDRIVDLTSVPSVGYLRRHDLLYFAQEAELLRKMLYVWDRCHAPRSQHIARLFEFDDSWAPPPRQPGWPETAGRLKRLRLDEGLKSPPKKVGRPLKPPSK